MLASDCRGRASGRLNAALAKISTQSGKKTTSPNYTIVEAGKNRKIGDNYYMYLKYERGHLVSMGTGAVNRSSKLQSWVTLSITEAEYVAAVDAGKEAVWMCNLLSELGYKFNSLSVLHMDNNSVIAIAKNPEKFSHVKHIDVQLYWLKEAVEEGVVKPQYCPKSDMPADLLTKVLAPVKVSHLRELMGLE
jgi:hypothetical protein